MTNKEWLASLPAREFYDQLEQIKHDKGRGAPNTRLWMIEWLDQEHTETEVAMDRRTEVMGWLEDLTHDDWDAWNSVSEVQNTAKAALELLKEDCHNCKLECLLQKYDQLKEKFDKLLKEQEWTLIMEDADGYLHGLPGDDGRYLMTDGKDIWIDDYVDGVDDGVWLDSCRDIREIKAWMYMPNLPILD